MALANTLKRRLFEMFTTTSGGSPAINTVSEIVGAVSGSFAPSGLKVRIKITNMTVTDTKTAIPLTPLIDRNSMIIENRSAIDSIFVGENDVTASGGTEGWEIPVSSGFSTDITDAIILYVVAPAGKTVNVKIMELA